MVDWKRQKFSEIAEACENNHGAAYRRYITSLIAMRSRLPSYVRHRVDHFIRHVQDDQDSDLSRDIAKRFALLYTGGMLARRSGLVAWESKEILSAIKKCYVKARSMLPDDRELLRAGIGILAQNLTSLPIASNRNKGRFSKQHCDVLDGFKQPGLGRVPCLIKRHVFDNLFVSRHQQELVEAWLLNNGRLAKALPKGAASNIPVPKEQHIWPDGERRRSLEIRWSPSDIRVGNECKGR
jgi:hypothetical protein